MTIRVRFAPSPTGLLHLGGVRTALYNYLLAKQNNGTFILRIEDTDRSRYVEGSVENLITSLKELGIDYDEGPHLENKVESTSPHNSYYQSERLEIYHKHVEELISNGKAYRCYCTKEELEEMRLEQTRNNETTKYNGKCRDLEMDQRRDAGDRSGDLRSPHQQRDTVDRSGDLRSPHQQRDAVCTVRMKIPANTVFEFEDLVRGKIQISSEEIEDQVILKTDGFPTYHLAAVVDDHYMNISHVLRGEEWLYSTPKHIFLYEALGWKPPIWVHLPLLLNTDKSKLSKRHGDFSVANYLNMGYLKEAIINFVALLGWHGADDKELYTLEELIKEFSLDRISKSGAVFDITKLDWMNSWYIKNLPLDQVAKLCKPYFIKENIDISDEAKFLKVINRVREQITKLTDVVEHSKVFYQEIDISEENLAILKTVESQKVINWFCNKLGSDDVATLIKNVQTELNIKGKNLFFPLRIALYGDCHGPDIPLLVDILGVLESKRRLGKYQELNEYFTT